MQIINLALVMGVVAFLGIACYMVFIERGGQGTGPQDAPPILTLVGAAMLVPFGIMSFFLPGIMVNSSLGKIAAGTWQPPDGRPNPEYDRDEVKLLIARQTGLIIGLAMLEGPAFVVTIAFLLEGRVYALPLVAVAIILLLVRFPTEGSVRVWLQEQLDKINAMRS